jgi:hypothetical protein
MLLIKCLFTIYCNGKKHVLAGKGENRIEALREATKTINNKGHKTVLILKVECDRHD